MEISEEEGKREEAAKIEEIDFSWKEMGTDSPEMEALVDTPEKGAMTGSLEAEMIQLNAGQDLRTGQEVAEEKKGEEAVFPSEIEGGEMIPLHQVWRK